jgi:serine O-acetyltransferase
MTEYSSAESTKKMNLGQLIRSDVRRLGGLRSSIFRLGFYAAFYYRLSHFFSDHHMTFLAGFFQFFSQTVTGAEISHRAQIGPGLCFLHPVGVHIGPGIQIGSNATICECSSVVFLNPENPPVVGDFLWLGPGARIMGDVTLGDQVRVGPNSVVLKNIASQMTAFGIPARALPKDFSPPGTFHPEIPDPVDR